METINIILIIIIIFVVIYVIYQILYKYNGRLHIDNLQKPKYKLNKKKIAICFSGQIRDGFEKTLMLQKIFLIDSLDADVFCCFEDTSQDKKDFIKKVLNPNNIIYVNDYKPPNECIINLGTMSMYNKIFLANKLKIDFENNNNFKYDYVIRIRPDLIIKEHLPEYIFDNQIDNQIYMPIISKAFISYGYPDFMGISTSHNMDIYSNIFLFLLNSKSNTCNISETLLYSYLQQNNLIGIIFEYPIQLYRFSYDNFENIYESIKYIISLFDRYVTKNNCNIIVDL